MALDEHKSEGHYNTNCVASIGVGILSVVAVNLYAAVLGNFASPESTAEAIQIISVIAWRNRGDTFDNFISEVFNFKFRERR